ncbi:Na+/H+ antiporter subunit E [Pseudonocardia sp.]|jgi:multicomponent Na+:H+ antiporter subunit E|uniref:Na+/H+ antiporter subunit E n=1 Tax=Pseudonocardia sp. TaxID=60912 RepID=UPI002615DABC|nr:Na+/H+ antiporter subunit E [Pseudonocardia sp.]MCW2722008.1 cation antiporter [Pseudonocardia sp.]MDT7614379.1 multicomponent Na+:H+ antiporter subunit [Pseudonocardiales bacterium]
MTRVPRSRWTGLLWLTVVWVLLWGVFTPLTVVGGLVVAVLVTVISRQAPASERLPLRPVRLLGLVAYLLYDLVVSGAEVSWEVLRRGPDARGAIMSVPLLSGSERVVALMASALSLAPGAMALEIDHDNGVWYVYALGPRDDAGVRKAWLRTMDMQRRVLATFGTPDELRRAERLILERAS